MPSPYLPPAGISIPSAPGAGNTYRGTLWVEGDKLKLCGYVGVPLFGRTETWQRVTSGYRSRAIAGAPGK